jgi:prolyl-tRNA editing enzyme YbaK/EbsC (Cys-tRNA(Pro) deacylase)
MAVSQFEVVFRSYFPDGEILVSDEPTKTAQQAADVHGVPVAAIVKSILLKAEDEFVLFLVPGDKRIDLEIAAQKLNGRSKISDRIFNRRSSTIWT